MSILTTASYRFEANGCVYDGDFQRGQRHGIGTCTFPGGERYSGSWEKGKMHGEGTLEMKGRTLAGERNFGCAPRDVGGG